MRTRAPLSFSFLFLFLFDRPTRSAAASGARGFRGRQKPSILCTEGNEENEEVGDGTRRLRGRARESVDGCESCVGQVQQKWICGLVVR